MARYVIIINKIEKQLAYKRTALASNCGGGGAPPPGRTDAHHARDDGDNGANPNPGPLSHPKTSAADAGNSSASENCASLERPRNCFHSDTLSLSLSSRALSGNTAVVLGGTASSGGGGGASCIRGELDRNPGSAVSIWTASLKCAGSTL
nr:hypothetical protein Itr_chr05CG04120 [Ipomoea trifida]